MKTYFEKLIRAKEAAINEIRTKIAESEDVNEVRSLGELLNAATNELNEARAQLAKLDEPASVGGFNPLATYRAASHQAASEPDDGDPTNTKEYRCAFRDSVLNRKPIPVELRENTLTTDVESVIPTYLVNKIYERFDECGMILPLLTKTNIAAGIVVPTSAVKPVASWVAEGEGSARQKKTTGKITFAHFKLRCEISMSMEVGTMALEAFEALFVKQVADAMIIAVEKAFLAGDGTTQPTGILSANVTPETEITLEGDVPTYEELCDIEGAIPAAYEGSARWFMTKQKFMKVQGITDSNGQPIARVTFGIGGKVERHILGREAVIHPYADEMGDNFAAIFDPSDYILNKIYDMKITRKQDWDTEDLLTKAVMAVDGKPVSVDSLITIRAGS
ncbi:MAG: phage major capsid protein [Clostridia bacterium]|nr:phage major capsid protein [Clostridia bacterium]